VILLTKKVKQTFSFIEEFIGKANFNCSLIIILRLAGSSHINKTYLAIISTDSATGTPPMERQQRMSGKPHSFKTLQ
jgi:hypothetical protein